MDRNIIALDGNDTAYGKDIIATVTPKTTHTKIVTRGTPSPHERATTGQIHIQFHKVEGNPMVKIKCNDLAIKEALYPTSNLGLFWKT